LLAVNIVAISLIVFGICVILGLTPERIGNDLLAFLRKEKSLSYKVKLAQGKVKKSRLQAALNDMHNALKATGSENKFAVLISISVIGLVAGCLFAAMIGNIVFVPAFALISFVLPYAYAKMLAGAYNKQLTEELETALSIITTSYIAKEDIIYAIENSIDHIRQPVKQVFKEFLGKTKLINSNVKLAILQMKDSINNEIFHEWCDNLIECQDNITLKHSLQPLTSRLADIRIVNAELAVMLSSPRREYITMLIMMLANIPLLLVLNRDWGMVLFDTFVGQLVLGITAMVCVITGILCYKFTQPIEFKR
jgi:Flp pilus assembly protein TadB